MQKVLNRNILLRRCKRRWPVILVLILVLGKVSRFSAAAAGIENVNESQDQGATDNPDTEGAIIFDADAVRNRTDNYSALSDLHGIAVFTDAFIARETLYKEQTSQNRDQIGRIIFASMPPEAEYRAWAQLVLSAADQRVIREEYQPTTQTTDNWYWFIGAILSAAVLGIALVIEDIRKKRRKRIESYRDHRHQPQKL